MSEMTEAEVAEQEDLWAKEMLQIYDDAAVIGYEASGFRGLVASHGPMRAAKMLINTGTPSDGFTELWKLNRLDISVEARALKPEFRALFSDSELAISRRRLVEYGWSQRPPGILRRPVRPCKALGIRASRRPRRAGRSSSGLTQDWRQS